MAKAGLFNDLDVAVHWHPTCEKTRVINQSSLSSINFTVEFFGQAAHAGIDPWNGRSALDAVELMNYGVNLMREHIKPTTRIHYVIPNAGEVPNVVPEYAKVWYLVRAINRNEVEKYYERILKIAKGAAIATETTNKVTMISGVHETLLNRSLIEIVQSNLELIGASEFTEEEQNFAREMQKYLKIEEKGFDNKIKPLSNFTEPPASYSTDIAEVSQITPTVGFQATTAPIGIPWHSWAATSSHGTSGGIKGAILATKVMTMTCYDILTDSELINKTKLEFLDKRGRKPYNSLLPKD